MPRTENDHRTPYAKAAGRRVTRGLELVAKIRAELYSVEQALSSGRYIYHTSLAELSVRLGATMAELEALEEMNEDAEAVAAIEEMSEATPDPAPLSEALEACLRAVAETRRGTYNVRTSDWVWESAARTRRIFLELEQMGFVKVHKGERSNHFIAEITNAGKTRARQL